MGKLKTVLAKTVLAGLTAFALTACQTAPTPLPVVSEHATADVSGVPGRASDPSASAAGLALYPHYDSLDAATFPKASPGVSLPSSDTVLTRILFGSCLNEKRVSPLLDVIAAEKADMFLMIGDNVYGDAYGGNFDLNELQTSYSVLAATPGFIAVRSALPMLTTWDDHDYGLNDAGGDFTGKRLAERLFETFWASPDHVVARPGIHDAYIFGPEGQRVQIILLDTRFFRSELTPTDQRNAAGKERYLPSQDPDQAMLGEAQWAWLEAELKKPADIRFLVSSIQIIPDVHGWEAWATMPRERQRLYDLIGTTGARGVIALSGDRHMAALYRRDGVLDYPLYEATSSSLNFSFANTSSELDAAQLSEAYPPVNYGDVAIDWAAGEVRIMIRGEDNAVMREMTVPLSEIR
jgi:alkaline phosphatase D